MIALIGDSLAVGIADHSPAHVRVDARVGRTSEEAARALRRAKESRLWVSLGANDNDRDPETFRAVVRIALKGRVCVAWVDPPLHPRLRGVLRQEARRDGRLKVVSIKGVQRSDGIHPDPKGYRTLEARLARSCPLKGKAGLPTLDTRRTRSLASTSSSGAFSTAGWSRGLRA